MRRIFVPVDQVDADAGSVIVRGEDVAHIRDVLRLGVGDEVDATCGRGVIYHCHIDDVADDEIQMRIDSEKADISELPVKISLYQALPKGDKMELVIQKAVELGVSEIVPIRTARCVVRLDEAKAAKKRVRWQRIAVEASKQSGRGIVPDIVGLMDISEAADRAGSSDYIVIPYEMCEESGGLRRLRERISEGVSSIAIFIGAEGGFEQGEVDMVRDAGGDVISLGHRILRTETAAIAVMSHIMMMIEELS